MILELNDLCCGYGGKAIIKDIRLSVGSGDVFCILGENGVGKSTGLLLCLCGAVPYTSVPVFRAGGHHDRSYGEDQRLRASRKKG